MSAVHVSAYGFFWDRLPCGAMSERPATVPDLPRTAVGAPQCTHQADLQAPAGQTRGPGNEDTEQNQALESKCCCLLCVASLVDQQCLRRNWII